MSAQQPAGWQDQERIRRWIEGSAQRELQLAPVSEELFAAADLQPGEVVLDVGTGTGPTSVRAARAVGPLGRVVGSDLAPAMIEIAREAAEVEGIEWLVADAQTHDFGEAVFDAVISRYGVMFFPDPVAAFTNLARAAKPGGRLTMAVWQTRDNVPLFAIPYDVAAAVLDARGLTYTPVPIDDSQCSLGSHDRVVAALEPASWREIETHPTNRQFHVGGELTAEQAAHEALDIGPIRGLLEGRSEEIRDQVRAALTIEYRHRHDGTGVLMDGGFMIVTARR